MLSSFCRYIYFTLVLFQAFRFLRPVKRPRIRLRILQFTLSYLHLLIYTIVLCIISYELYKIDKIWEIRNNDYKSLISTEDNYL